MSFESRYRAEEENFWINGSGREERKWTRSH